ncbi:3-hydroxyacyl-CoA dehydrogenase [Sphingobium jiangsuense]|uniref:NAD(P)-dependent dehydrogenase (Short-subunit alcohol dehydrogenase family) n=1 Tax=Sphingobium jiangsuense TaxID=870476 RepID=A0A7W6BNJ7_9SPHN|nr:SDR family NAD(P)-dependent oxidoreductase [Sphingobium jiangsuense]MBB3926872.1 NAD(P)-dependent dehydrogenase (short-subunit alcohol dehydrogenase family) [Sphingobium jiangsuense]GLS98880.1 3-hydroxyacyl-CoA dehydrogenase [Sphingobium jiangsuense]
MAILTDRVVAITGAGRGIGRELALLCAKEGACVVVNDFGVTAAGEGSDAGPAHDVVAEIERAGGRAWANLASVTDPHGAASIVEDAVQRFGRIDAVVNNAGFLRDGIWHKMSFENWRAVIDVHLNGAFNVSKAATPYFKAQGSGSFIHFTSTSGLIGNVGQANYSAAKMAIVGLSQSIALDMQRFGVRSNCIAPFAWSRMIATINGDDPAEQARLRRMQSMSADKIAPLVAFLASDRSKEITNQIFAVRKNELFLFSKPKPVRSIHRSGGWSAQSIADEFIPAIRSDLAPMLTSPELFNWDPV